MCTVGAGYTGPLCGSGVPLSLQKFTDTHSNILTRVIPWPEVLSKYYSHSNVIDTHNQLRQHLLALEERWNNTNGFFRVYTTLMGINVIDSMKVYTLLHQIWYGKPPVKLPVQSFTNRFCEQLLGEESLKKLHTNYQCSTSVPTEGKKLLQDKECVYYKSQSPSKHRIVQTSCKDNTGVTRCKRKILNCSLWSTRGEPHYMEVSWLWHTTL